MCFFTEERLFAAIRRQIRFFDDDGVEVRLPDLGDVGESFLEDGYFTADGGISSVRVLFHRDTKSDRVLAPSGVWINGESRSFAAPEKPLELSQETRDLVSGIIADKKLDWL